MSVLPTAAASPENTAAQCVLFLLDNGSRVEMRDCLFCDNPANSREHLWADWILKSLKIREASLRRVGTGPLVTLNDPDPKAKYVCKKCNEGWMSGLEDAARKAIGPLLHDVSRWIDATEQETIVRWSLKTAMVFEALTLSGRTAYYSKSGRQSLRLGLAPPERTNAWIGRFHRTGLGAFGLDIKAGTETHKGVVNAYCTSLVVGHLVIQVVTLHAPVEYDVSNINLRAKGGWLMSSLVPIWPTERTVLWPPQISFTDPGGLFPLTDLLSRFKV